MSVLFIETTVLVVFIEQNEKESRGKWMLEMFNNAGSVRKQNIDFQSRYLLGCYNLIIQMNCQPQHC